MEPSVATARFFAELSLFFLIGAELDVAQVLDAGGSLPAILACGMLGRGFGVFLAFPILGAVGYVPNAAQPEAVVLTLKILYALVPSLFNLLGLWVAWHYPIDKAAHEKILEAVRARRAGERFADPLEAP